MATIELGEISAGPPEHARDGGTGSVRLPSRPVRVGLALVLLLATLTSGAPAARPLPEATVLARTGADAFAVGDQFIVADPVVSGETEHWLTAYRLPDGVPLWRVSMPLRGNVGQIVRLGDTLVLTAVWGAVIPPETVALDAATGAERWRRIAWLDGFTDRGDVLLWTSRYGDWAQGEERPGTLRAASVETGAQRWAIPLPAGTQRGYERPTGWAAWRGEAAARLAVINLPSGEIRIHDIGTGEALRSVRPPGPEHRRWYLVEITNDLLILNDGYEEVVGYELDDLRIRWTLTRRADPREYGPLPCGPLLCLHGERGGARALDPSTGSVRWTADRWGALMPAGDLLVAGSLDTRSRSRARPLSLIEPYTGVVLGELGAWEVLGPAPDGSLVGIRDGPEARTWIARIDPVRRRAGLLARLRDVSGDCRTGSGVVYCRRVDTSIGIWRLPS